MSGQAEVEDIESGVAAATEDANGGLELRERRKKGQEVDEMDCAKDGGKEKKANKHGYGFQQVSDL